MTTPDHGIDRQTLATIAAIRDRLPFVTSTKVTERETPTEAIRSLLAFFEKARGQVQAYSVRRGGGSDLSTIIDEQSRQIIVAALKAYHWKEEDDDDDTT